jgi:pre-mRNA-processing factor 19
MRSVNRTDDHSALTTVQFHPDGHLLAAGGVDGQIRVFETKTGDIAAVFNTSRPVQAMSFSENGIWLASVVQGSTSVSIWDLRKAEEAKVLEIGGQITNVRWDYTGQFLATAGPSGITVQQYSKSAKAWSEPLKSAVPAVDVAWGAKAQNLVSLDQGVITVLGSS